MKEMKEIEDAREIEGTEKLPAIKKTSASTLETSTPKLRTEDEKLVKADVTLGTPTPKATTEDEKLVKLVSPGVSVTVVKNHPPVKRPAVSSPAPLPRRAVPSQAAGTKKESASVTALRERCRQIGFSLFFDAHTPIRSLGITSAIAGEGKSFLASVMADALSEGNSSPVTLVECNWEHPTLHEQFGLSPTPGLAEWLRGECSEEEVRHEVTYNLTVIPAGNGKQDAVQLLQHIRQQGLATIFPRTDELLIVDLPAVITSAYSIMAASIVDMLLLVLRSGVTPESTIADATEQLRELPVYGVVLNQIESHIPRWLRQLL
jgi:Mrp family chromosome partitioning ATPase